MEHKNSFPLSDEQLNAIIDGVADASLVEQATQHPDSAARLAALQHWQGQLTAQLARWDCPPPQQLADYHWGGADRVTSQTIARHLQGCVRCTEELQTLRTFLNADMPHTAANNSPVAARPARSRLPELVAVLLPSSPGLAVRGDGRAPLVAEVDDTTIVLDVQSGAAGKVALLGQVAAVAPDRWTGALVEVRQAGRVEGTAEIDAVASFQCGPLPVGVSELRITAPDGTSIVLPEVELRHA